MKGKSLSVVAGLITLAGFVVNILANAVSNAQMEEAVEKAVNEKFKTMEEESEKEET